MTFGRRQAVGHQLVWLRRSFVVTRADYHYGHALGGVFEEISADL